MDTLTAIGPLAGEATRGDVAYTMRRAVVRQCVLFVRCAKRRTVSVNG